MTSKDNKIYCAVQFAGNDKETVEKLHAVTKALGFNRPIHWFRQITITTYNDLVARGLIQPRK